MNGGRIKIIQKNKKYHTEIHQTEDTSFPLNRLCNTVNNIILSESLFSDL